MTATKAERHARADRWARHHNNLNDDTLGPLVAAGRLTALHFERIALSNRIDAIDREIDHTLTAIDAAVFGDAS